MRFDEVELDNRKMEPNSVTGQTLSTSGAMAFTEFLGFLALLVTVSGTKHSFSIFPIVVRSC